MYLSRESLSQNDKARFILIEDTLEDSGRPIILALTKLFMKENESVAYISYDLPQDRINNVLDCQSNNFTTIDGFSNPFGWINTPTKSVMDLKLFENIKENVIVLDSLSPLLIHHSSEAIYRALHKVLNTEGTFKHVLALLHSDAHSTKQCAILQSLSTTILNVDSQGKPVNCLLSTVKYGNRKITQQILRYAISPNLDHITFKEIIMEGPTKTQVKRPDPTANLMFNLRLTEDEKANRERVELPFSKVQSSPSVINAGVILEDDFYDEDDPDDDLDI